MKKEVIGSCGNSIILDTDCIEFAYEIKMFDKNIVYCGLKSGKKLFIDMNISDFKKLL